MSSESAFTSPFRAFFRLVPKFRTAAFRRPSAFTLAELIVVITILAILATVGFVSLQGYSSDARDSSLKANVRSIYTAISSESASTGNSPRYYVMHDTWAALAGAVAYADGNPLVLTGGDWNASGTNYSAGNPDYAKLKVNPNKFRTSAAFGASSNFFTNAFLEASAAYSSTGISVGAVDYVSSGTSAGRSRSSSWLQVGWTNPSSKVSFVSGNYPATAGIAGLIRNTSSQGAQDVLFDGFATYYPGCDTADVVLSNGQKWAACNVGATLAWTGGTAFVNTGAVNQPNDYNSAIRNTLGSYFQWGRNEDVAPLGTVSTLAPAGSSSSTVLGNFITDSNSYPYDWITVQNGNLWGGSGTTNTGGTFADRSSGDKVLMKGPCATGYHVPTQAEWWSTISSLNGALTNTGTWQNDTSVVLTLKLPLSGMRKRADATFGWQGQRWYYWTSSQRVEIGWGLVTNASIVSIASTSIAPESGYGRANGFSVRCLAN